MLRLIHNPVEAGAMGVGPSLGDISWWSNSDAEVTGIRACQFDDVYHFESDGTFQNRLGAQTYVEGWQGGNGCGSPAAPHDGSKNGKWIYNSSNKTIMIIGKGSFLGIPKVYTGGELTAPANTVLIKMSGTILYPRPVCGVIVTS